jgi:prepilin-type N-terminal cleavage/methylation domain-containing protein
MQEELSCLTCGFANGLDHRFCRRCGALLEDYSDEPEQKLELVLTTARKSKTPFTLLEVLIVIIIVGILAAIAIPSTSRRGHHRSRSKSCMANMRVLSGAVEMYNMDNNVMLSHFDHETIQRLIDGKYLKSTVTCPGNPPGIYGSDGDLSREGVVSCSAHGTVENPIIPNNERD